MSLPPIEIVATKHYGEPTSVLNAPVIYPKPDRVYGKLRLYRVGSSENYVTDEAGEIGVVTACEYRLHREGMREGTFAHIVATWNACEGADNPQPGELAHLRAINAKQVEALDGIVAMLSKTARAAADMEHERNMTSINLSGAVGKLRARVAELEAALQNLLNESDYGDCYYGGAFSDEFQCLCCERKYEYDTSVLCKNPDCARFQARRVLASPMVSQSEPGTDPLEKEQGRN